MITKLTHSRLAPRRCSPPGLVALAVAFAIGHAVPGTAGAAEESAFDFNRDIRPILSDKCFFCHGPDAQKREADLRLDTREGAIEDHDGVRAIDPANLPNSDILFRIETDDETEIMPPPESNKPLTAEEIALLKQWIEAGAPYEQHWAFVTPTRPELPAVSVPEWPANPIDRFVLARLDREGMPPAGEADRRTLYRRLSFDLTGLPPTPEEVEAFVADDQQGAYERAVDHLLASPHYGEHMARYWLDAARYGDTHGLHLDNYREMWPYRDWVIRAFNTNKSFRDFTVEQLAGDLLPDATLEQVVATGFNRAHVTTAEGGSIDEEVYVRNVKDRIDTFGTVFLGMTVNCASCHDHKYDPLSQTEYYQLFSYFNSLDGPAMDGNQKDPAPVVKVPTPELTHEIDELRHRVQVVREEIAQRLAGFEYAEPANPEPPQPPAPVEFVWIDDSLPAGVREQGGWQFVGAPDHPVHSGEKSHVREAQGLSQHFFDQAGEPLTIGEGDRLFAWVHLDPANPPKEIMLQWNADNDWNHRAYWGGNHIDWGSDGTPSRLRIGELPPAGEWVRLEVAAADVGLPAGARIQGWAFTQFDGKVHWDTAGIVTRTSQRPAYHSLRQWIQAQREAEQPDAPEAIIAILRKDHESLTEGERRQVTDHFVEHVFAGSRELFDPLHAEIAEFEKAITEIEGRFPTTMVFRELPEPKEAFFLHRGEYDQKRDKVERATPAFLPPQKEGSPANRLGLAQWLVDPAHPLMARVTVNRFWQQIFGTGLVKTAEDFGAQGQMPSHPKLLDWLAVEFVESGWDVKALMKMLVMSSTYRQSATVTPEKLSRDPQNRLLARGPRFRLDAEALRDQALFVSGLLQDAIGGPSVKPPQPAGLWEAVGYTSSNTARFVADEGPEKVHRRSLYTFWKRTAPPPQMNTFDAPSRESCTVRRERTNTPLQALLLLNEPQYLECARSLAERSLTECKADARTRIRHLFELAALRPPADDEVDILLGAYADHAAKYQADPEAARKLVAIGTTPPNPELDPSEVAAWTMVASIVLNLDEVLTKG